jgi:radical SAM protein with 4Fe4S-binding SPASM domain
MKFNLDKVYSINPDYLLRHDIHRTFIVSRDKASNNSSDGWKSIIHPVQAQIFSFFTHGTSLESSVKNLCQYLESGFDNTLDLITPYIENDEEFKTVFNDIDFLIPKNFIIESEKTYKKFTVEDFQCETLDGYGKRMYSGPMDITLMVTNTCATNCVYCYADINHKVENHLSLDSIKRIIKNAYELNVNDFGLLGGEIFFNKDWKEIYLELLKYDFFPEILSTKYPLKEDQILFFKEHGITKIQISLDSVDEETLLTMLNTRKSYKSKIFNTIALLDKYDFEIQIAITLTKYNGAIQHIKDILNFLSGFKNISQVDIGPAFYSLYLENNFDEWGISKNDFDLLVDHFLNQEKSEYHFDINFDTSFTERGFYSCYKGSSYFPGGACSANRTHLFILPDGKATICEQLYWNEDFIIGDLNTQSLEEVWNSSKALKLANLERDNFSDLSPCKTCNNFVDCHDDVNKCWVDIIKAYGKENWDYPDPRCAYAPKMINNIQF